MTPSPQMYSSAAIANRFLRIAEREDVPLTPMKIQKLVYIAHGWHLGLYDEPLCSEIVQAWKWGPVFPDLYHSVKHWGNRPIREPVRDYWDEDEVPPVPDDDSSESHLIDDVWSIYRGYTGSQLSRLTHAADTPWDQVVKERQGRWYPEISDGLIDQHYKEMLSAEAAE